MVKLGINGHYVNLTKWHPLYFPIMHFILLSPYKLTLPRQLNQSNYMARE